MKKGLRLDTWLDFYTAEIPTADLMKKGLRQYTELTPDIRPKFQQQT